MDEDMQSSAHTHDTFLHNNLDQSTLVIVLCTALAVLLFSTSSANIYCISPHSREFASTTKDLLMLWANLVQWLKTLSSALSQIFVYSTRNNNFDGRLLIPVSTCLPVLIDFAHVSTCLVLLMSLMTLWSHICSLEAIQLLICMLVAPAALSWNTPTEGHVWQCWDVQDLDQSHGLK